MFQLFTRTNSETQFKARSSTRDMATDAARVASVAGAIDDALRSARAEYAGLAQRVNDATARAAITAGNDSDEYLDREPANSALQNQLNADIANGERRLFELDVSIGHFKFLKAALTTRFPDHAATSATVGMQKSSS
ncbi:hypothetical protein SR870_12325 [Rhodopseudomonas palustris]|uniref:hypothetical protein n=1 Tax=Rhodopseudomonas palustris TaxID=1076 RepID=UPI002ACED5F2|nr:hypothetical protein [Rhodopseudomonas palustris]WQG97507.1 hypothetical protein SR870_12325 [Rhodopseudomonas palustris]